LTDDIQNWKGNNIIKLGLITGPNGFKPLILITSLCCFILIIFIVFNLEV